jgi:hypothetical protein
LGHPKKLLSQSSVSPIDFTKVVDTIQQKLKSMASGIAFIAFLGYYVVTFRRYQAAVDKHSSLTALINDPSVRVVSGE